MAFPIDDIAPGFSAEPGTASGPVSPRRPRVALCQGGDRAANLTTALELVIDDIDWSGRRHVVVKPNLVLHDRPAAITHGEALDRVLRLVRQRYSGRLTVAEGSALTPTTTVFAKLGYPELVAEHEVDLVDLNADATTAFTVCGRHGEPRTVHVARTVLGSDCRISLALPKTHDTVRVTLSIKNMVMGSVANRELQHGVVPRQGALARLRSRCFGPHNDKLAMHQGYAGTNINLTLLAARLMPHLAVIDGYHGMEGAGPTDGELVHWGIAVASTDALAADSLTAHLMGFKPGEVGYLTHCAQLGLGCADLDAMDIVGQTALEAARRNFRRHPTDSAQRQWHCASAARWLARAQPAARPADQSASLLGGTP